MMQPRREEVGYSSSSMDTESLERRGGMERILVAVLMMGGRRMFPKCWPLPWEQET